MIPLLETSIPLEKYLNGLISLVEALKSLVEKKKRDTVRMKL